MRRVVSLLHRQAVRAKAEGLFFKVRDILHCYVYLFLNRSGFYAQPFQNHHRRQEIVPP